MKSFELIQKLVIEGKIDPLIDEYPVGFSIGGSGRIILKFTASQFMNFRTFAEIDKFVTNYVSENFNER